MALIIKKTTPIHTPAPAGLHHAICIRIIDLGTQKTNFAGKQKKQPKILIGWEIVANKPEMRQADGKPFVIFKRYTASLNDKASLAIDLKGWYGKPIESEEFDLMSILGKPCAINIMHDTNTKDGKTYANIQSVSSPMEGFPIPAPETIPEAFDLANPNWTLFADLSDFVRDTIRKSPEYAALDLPDNAPPPLSESTPTVSMPVDDTLWQTILHNIKERKATPQEILAMGYDLSEAQRLEIENLI